MDKNGFIAYISHSDDGIRNTPEWFDIFNTEVEWLISVWLEKYIELHEPGFSLTEALAGIQRVSVDEENIEFSFINPFTKVEEVFSFWRNIFESLLTSYKEKINDALLLDLSKIETDDIKQKIFDITPEILDIIKYWYPRIEPNSIIWVETIHVNSGDMAVDYDARDDYLTVLYFTDTGEIRSQDVENRLPSSYKYLYREDIMRELRIERNKINYMLLKNWVVAEEDEDDSM